MGFFDNPSLWFKRIKWTFEDINYFSDDTKYSQSSPVQKHIQTMFEFMRSTVILGGIALLFTTYSVRSKVYGNLSAYRPRIMFLSILSIGSVIFLINML